ncbi:hypothetical protein DUY81_13945 [Acidipropionibacterium acidipropionici]|uniref:Uncharacterized protein n=1 Tax=Acidipropionibacterium acidipropionici TaxID=1748 RepID=A0AAC8YH03_9ACTN|nr:hypothetical protein [Acidipropionibacterium acidipropionici]AMS06468.1 hypothetical protein AXH35_14420 [Acidipropionibacterium acidipropionici]AOZ47915.1 hypothetical protein A8L58_15875 [Acidipropionibacterium acidipropionici]AZP38739.1 hypothetical protein DUY81_13945 [Acidipropionibacterium acidipropionici]
MSWFKVDDQFFSHPKALQCSTQAIGVWTLMGSWSSQQLTDGFIPKGVLGLIRATEDDTQELTEAGLLVKTRGGWKMHDFTSYNPTAEKVREDRQKEADRKREWREKKAARRGADGHVPPSVPPGQNPDATRD